MQRTHLLIVGSPRSGTTLLASMIGAHSKASVLIEDPRFLLTRLAGTPVVGNKLCIPTNVELRRRSRRPDQLARALLGTERFRRLPFAVRRRLQPTSHHSIVDYLGLDDARLVAVVREGGEVVHSIMQRGPFGYDEAVHQWRRAVEVVDELLRIVPDRVHLLSYDRLVTEPEAEMRAVAAFLGLEFERTMLEGFAFNVYYPGRDGTGRPAPDPEAAAVTDRLGREEPALVGRYEALAARAVTGGARTGGHG